MADPQLDSWLNNDPAEAPENDRRQQSEVPARGSLTFRLRNHLNKRSSDGVSWQDRLVQGLLEFTDRGSLRAMLEIWTRLDGKPGSADPSSRDAVDIDDKLARQILELGRDQGPAEPD